ncbi:M23 family metallopeptidase [Planctobacterium marinum]|uniref:M23ase beta-sheet core domain-containing protein n=1 Tax=Planctobacterium marinum TaxID=1631968 RepID=A0AA48HZD3_9ALTE|nr:hypothetical protein MACH26_29260 [Planctobacterium marinum]
MKKQLLSLLLAGGLSACGYATPEVNCEVFAEQGKSLYQLPYQKGETFEVYAATSHYRKANQGVGLYAIDFPMPIGTKIVASRAGEVVALREEFKDNNGVDLQENFVFILHDDGTVARYFHLTYNGVLVSLGEMVEAGQIIALSGNTGQSGGPHLHFDVQQCGPNLPPGYNKLPCGQTVPVVFNNTQAHECGVQEGHRYTAR